MMQRWARAGSGTTGTPEEKFDSMLIHTGSTFKRGP